MKQATVLVAVISVLTTSIQAVAVDHRRTLSLPKCDKQSKDRCCFSIIAVGLPSGNSPVLVNSSGETLINTPATSQSNFCVCASNPGGPTDDTGRTCFIDKITKQFKCREVETDDSPFAVGNDQNLLVDGCPNYLACPRTNDSYEIFGETKPNAVNCTSITLRTGGFVCASLGRPSDSSGAPTIPPTVASSATFVTSRAVVSTTTPSNTTSLISSTTSAPTISVAPFITYTTTAGPQCTGSTLGCPTDISGGEFAPPNLIIPVSKSSPTQQYGPSYYPRSDDHQSTLFSFDVLPSWAGRLCSLIFTFPYASEATFPYSFSGIEKEVLSNGGLDFALLNGTISEGTSYVTTPPIQREFGKTDIIPGNNYTIARFPCQAGRKAAYRMKSIGNVALTYFQSSRNSPVGAWIVPCKF